MKSGKNFYQEHTGAMLEPHVLVVDDEEAMRWAMRKALATEGYRLSLAADGAEGLQILRQSRPDLVFLDLRMPGMDGLAFLEEANVRPEDPYMIVMVTGHGDDAGIARSYERGVNFFLRKPMSSVEILCLARRCIEIKRLERRQLDLIRQLKEALAASRTLKELLPICSSCRKIRDDQGYWQVLEAYIRNHTATDFTHGICPECAQKLYPDFYS
jgi:CheY-like chemotaxis protein